MLQFSVHGSSGQEGGIAATLEKAERCFFLFVCEATDDVAQVCLAYWM